MQVTGKFFGGPLVSKETQHYFMINLRNLRECPPGGFSFSGHVFSRPASRQAKALKTGLPRSGPFGDDQPVPLGGLMREMRREMPDTRIAGKMKKSPVSRLESWCWLRGLNSRPSVYKTYCL
jgi:hypothetical protein